ncbi:MAG TPA: hypothetical protein VFG55_07260 [Rhodanobacteraceae bacterium]|nr:hypothetical protein [Rhodanobacteraceae bacterium]
MSIRLCVPICAALFFILDGPSALAICIPTHVYEVYVGDTASDSSCTYNSIQAALDATYACPTTIRITREHLWTSQHLTVNNKNLILQGEADGITCYQMANCIPAGGCHADTTTPLVTLDGNDSQGQSSGRVLDITGNSNITLRDLTIEHGVLDAFGHGGGVNFSGSGSLTLDTTTVISNIAGYGGGINVSASGGHATLTLAPYALIASNTAVHDGGGIHLEGDTRLLALQSPATILLNHAPNGDGGGLMVVGPARADLAAHSPGGTALVDSNDAAYGGGIAAVAIGADDGVDDAALVRLFTTDPRYPIGVTGNFASHTGGGIYLKPYRGFTYDAWTALCAENFQIDGNTAEEGSAIYADDDYNTIGNYLGGRILLNSDDPQFPICGSLPGVSCMAGVACNTVSDNEAADSNNNPTDGSAILVQTNGALRADRLEMRANQGGHTLRGVEGYVDVRNCLIAENSVTDSLLYQPDNSLIVNYCTIANNTVGGSSVIYAADGLSLNDSIIDEPGVPTLDDAGHPNGTNIAYDLSTEISTLAGGFAIVAGYPTFVDAANGNYRLQTTSLGVDFAPPVSGDDRDLDGLPHDQDLLNIPNQYGDRDLGAYEIQLDTVLSCAGGADTIFCNGFEASP